MLSEHWALTPLILTATVNVFVLHMKGLSDSEYSNSGPMACRLAEGIETAESVKARKSQNWLRIPELPKARPLLLHMWIGSVWIQEGKMSS